MASVNDLEATAVGRRAAAGGGARGAWAARAGGLPAAYWRIWTGTLVNRAGAVVTPFLALYLTTARGLSVGQAGVVLSCYGAGSMVARPAGGLLADRVGRRATLTGALATAAVLLAALIAARAVWLVVLLVLALGLVSDAHRPAAQAAIADLVPFHERRRAAGLHIWAINLGFSVAGAVGGALAAAGYGLLFALNAATCAVFALIVWRSVPETRPKEAAQTRGGYAPALHDRTFLALLAAQLLVAIGLLQLFVVLPLAMDHDGFGPGAYGLVIALTGVVIVILHPIVSARLLRSDPARVLALGAAFCAAGYVGFAIADGAAAYIAAAVVLTLGNLCDAAIGAGVVAEIAPPALRGRYCALFGLTFGVAAAVGPLFGTLLLGEGYSARPWLVCGSMSMLAAAGFLALGPALVRRRAIRSREQHT